MLMADINNLFWDVMGPIEMGVKRCFKTVIHIPY
jgi:hypothetical protein